MTDTFITRDEQHALVALLREIPEAVEDLAVNLSRQSRAGTLSVNLHARKDVQPLPFDLVAHEVADDLHATLVGWVRHVMESRGTEFAGGVSTLDLARWLDQHIVSLAMTEGCEEAHDEIRYAVRRARRACDSHPSRHAATPTELEVDEAIGRAHGLRVTPAQAEVLMPKLRHPGLKAATIRQWQARGKVERGDDGLYLLGDLLKLNPRREMRCHTA